MSLYILRHPVSQDTITCTYKKKSIPVGFFDDKLAKRVSVRIARDPKRVNCRLKTGNMLPIAQESYIYDDDTNLKLQGLRKDLDARIILHRDLEAAQDDENNEKGMPPWQIRRVPEDMFYAYPFTVHSGIVICYDIDAMNLLLPTHAFDKKNIFLKSVVMAYHTPSIGQLKRLYKR